MTNRAWVGSRKVAGDQKDDVVEIGIVVEAGDPRLIGRACMGGWRERQDRGDQAQTNEPVEDHGRETRSASAAPQQAYAAHAYSRDDLIVDSASDFVLISGRWTSR